MAKDLGRAPWLADFRRATNRDDPAPEPDPDPDPEQEEMEDVEASEELDEGLDFCGWCWC